MAVPKTVRSEKLDKRKLRLVVDDEGTYTGLSDGVVCCTGTDKDVVWNALVHGAGKSNPDYFGISGAIKAFRSHFPDGFAEEHYLSQEREYKVEAHNKILETLPLDDLDSMSNLGPKAASVFSKTNLLAANELIKLGPALKSPDGNAIVRAMGRFALEPTQQTLSKLARLLSPHESAKWTVVTYLPFLWQPDRHSYLKPTVTKDYASRIGHQFYDVYTPALKIETYDALRDLASTTLEQTASLKPKDNIDVQSFIWVVGAYEAADATA